MHLVDFIDFIILPTAVDAKKATRYPRLDGPETQDRFLGVVFFEKKFIFPVVCLCIWDELVVP